MIKKIIKVFIPKKLYEVIIKTRQKNKLKNEFLIDLEKFRDNSFSFTKEKEKRHLEADLIFFYHKIEKGLALPSPKVAFGKKNIDYLLNAIKKYVKKYGWEEVAVISLNTLFAYYSFNKQQGIDMKELYKEIVKLQSKIPKEMVIEQGGTKILRNEEIKANILDFERFVNTRYSVRNFSTDPVDLKQIEKAVEIAQKTPSVCNRQPSKVYVYQNKKEQEKILKYQNGNAGFGDTANLILIVTTDLKDFRGIIERNQVYVEGGLYSMSLMYALHAAGLGTCPLNLTMTNEKESQLKNAADIPESEIPIMMIAVGYIPEEIKVAESPRRKAKEVMTVVN